MAANNTGGLKPAMAPPPGEVSDFNTSDNLYTWNIVTQCVCLVIPSVLMIVRSSVRIGILRRWNMEDWLCLASWAFFMCYSSIVAFVMTHGGGIHQWNMTHETAMTVLYWNNVAQIVYSMSILTTKLSLLYLYLGIFAPSRYSKNWWTTVVIMIANTGFYWGLMFAKIFQCWPRNAIWDKTIHDGKCVSLVGILDASGAWNTLSDVTILVLPLLFIWRLKLSRERRIGIIAIFLVGVIAPVFSIIGVVVRVQTSASTDLTYYQPRLLFFAEAEITSGIICTCLPCLQRLYKWSKGSQVTPNSRSGERSYQMDARRRRTMLRDTNSDTNFLKGDYLELDENANHVAVPARTMKTNVSSGDYGRPEMVHGEIWKTTEVHVQSEVVDSESERSNNMVIAPASKMPGSAL